jgi:hypothetical protein
MLLGEEGDAVIAIGQASHAWISDQFARAAVLGVDVITTDRPAALHRELAATSLAA